MCRSEYDSQPELFTVQHISCEASTPPPASSKPTKKRKIGEKTNATVQPKEQELVPPHSPAMCTGSKTLTPDSSAIGTRSKRKILE